MITLFLISKARLLSSFAVLTIFDELQLRLRIAR